MKVPTVEIISIGDDTPIYTGYSDIVRFGDRYFRTEDAESYASQLKEIDKEEFNQLLKYKL